MAGMNIRRGRDAFKANTDAGRILYPEPESATNEHLAVIAEGDWVAVLLKRRARTNKVDDYENLYGHVLRGHRREDRHAGRDTRVPRGRRQVRPQRAPSTRLIPRPTDEPPRRPRS